MKTIMEQISKDIGDFKIKLEDFFQNHSNIKHRPPLRGVAMIGFSNYLWCELDEKGRKKQTELYQDYNSIYEIFNILSLELLPEQVNDIEKNKNKIYHYILQDDQVWEGTIRDVINNTNKSLDQQIKILKNIYNEKNKKFILIPDTNAILINPHLEDWDFKDIDKFEVILTPTVLSELDKLKITGRNDKVRNKANSIIRTIKEYRRRGKLTEGVTLSKCKSTIKALAIEPNRDKTFSWLDKDNLDDRLLMSFIEVIRKHPNSVVILITADINLQNKAEYSRLPYLEPPNLL